MESPSRLFTICIILLAVLFNPVETSVADGIADGSLAVSFTEHGEIRQSLWKRPAAAPVEMAFRQDHYAGFSFHMENGGNWDTQLPLVRVRPDRDEFALNRDGIVYSLAYTLNNSVLEVIAGIRNDTATPAEPVVTKIHINLKTPREVRVNFTASPLTASCNTGMQWLDAQHN